MPASTRAAAVLLYDQAAFLLLVTAGMLDIILEPPAGGTRGIAATVFVLGYAAILCVVRNR